MGQRLRIVGLLGLAVVVAISMGACRRTAHEGWIAEYLSAEPWSPLAAWGLAVSPDHRWLAFVLKPPAREMGQGSPYLGIHDLSTGGQTWVNTHLALVHDLAWSPTATALAFAGRGPRSWDSTHIAIFDRLSASVRSVTQPRGLSFDSWPAWSPTGEWIAFVRNDVGRRERDVWIVRPDGRDKQRVTFLGRIGPVGLCWSVDGRRIYYVADGDVYSSSVPGPDAAPVQVTHGMQARFIAQGKPESFIFCHTEYSDPTSKTHVLAVEKSGVKVREVAVVPEQGGDPLISPDGRRIAFLSDRRLSDYNPPEYGLYTIAMGHGGKRTQVATGVLSLASAGWLPNGEILLWRVGSICAVRQDGTGEREVLRLPDQMGP